MKVAEAGQNAKIGSMKVRSKSGWLLHFGAASHPRALD